MTTCLPHALPPSLGSLAVRPPTGAYALPLVREWLRRPVGHRHPARHLPPLPVFDEPDEPAGHAGHRHRLPHGCRGPSVGRCPRHTL